MINLELKEGMYIRYTRGMINGNIPPRIAKIVDCSDNELIKIDNGQVILNEDIIGEPSEHLIDLIEIGDYVNGYPVIFNVVERGGNIVIVIGGDCFTENKIKNIVTKEQFDNAKYWVER